MRKIFLNDILRKKKIPFKLWINESIFEIVMIYDSPGHVGLETLHQFLEGVKKTNFFLKIRRLFVKFSMNDVKIYLWIFPQSRG